ncbi:MAG: acylphosphatase [Caulobacteraceae bacterium]
MARGAARLIIRGNVQGVGYRWWARAEARRLGLAGWVRNRADGTVELVAAGPAAALDQLAEVCRRGPRAAGVTSVERSEASNQGVDSFEMRPTV